MTGLADLGLKNFIDLIIYKLIINYRKFNQDLEIDIVQFQKRINKLCKKYSLCERTAKRAFQRLADAGLIEIVYTLGFGKFVIRVKFLHDLFGQDDPPETEMSSPKTLEQRNSEKNQKTGVKQQQLIQTKQICKSVGINYRLEKDWWEIASHGVEKLQSTIEVMLSQLSNPRTIIRNPCGWLKVALRDNYYLDRPSVQDSIPILETMYFHAKDKLLDLVGSLPKKIGALD